MLSLAFLIFSSVSAKLTVINPDYLQSQFPEGEIAYDMANFGHNPYGHTIDGFLVVAKEQDGCGDFTESRFKQLPLFVMVRIGNCSFVQKAQQVQNAGGRMAIVVGEDDEINNKFVMANDGYGFNVSIPTIFIGQRDGKVLLDHYNTVKEDPLLAGLRIYFDVKRLNPIELNFGLSIEDRLTFLLFREIGQYLYDFINESAAKIEFNYLIYQCYECSLVNYTQPQKNCLGGGKYCALDPDGDKAGTGQDVLYEYLRQSCLSKIDIHTYIEYMKHFDLFCIQPSSYKFCGQMLLFKMFGIYSTKIQQKITKCLVESFVQEDESQITQDVQKNTIMEDFLHFKSFSGLIAYPGLVINGQPYLGNLEAEYIMDDICESVVNPSSTCDLYYKSLINDQQLPQPDDNNNSNISVAQILGIVLVVLIFSLVIMIVIYKKIIKKDVKDQTNGQVGQLVGQYIEFYQEKTQKNTFERA